SVTTRRELRQVDRRMYAARMLARQESGGAINEIEARYAEALREIEGRGVAERDKALAGLAPNDGLDRLYAGYEAAALEIGAAWERYREAAAEVDEACIPCQGE